MGAGGEGAVLSVREELPEDDWRVGAVGGVGERWYPFGDSCVTIRTLRRGFGVFGVERVLQMVLVVACGAR